MPHILVSLLSPIKDFLRHSGTGYLWDLKLIWVRLVISESMKGNWALNNVSFLRKLTQTISWLHKNCFQCLHFLPKVTAADQIALVLFHDRYPSIQTLNTVLLWTRKRAWWHLPIPWVTYPWVAQGASLGYREVVLDTSCPLIQSLLKSVRMLPFKHCKQYLPPVSSFPCSAVHSVIVLGDRGDLQQRNT